MIIRGIILTLFAVLAGISCGEKPAALDITFYETPEDLYLPGNSLRINGIVTDEIPLKTVSISNRLMSIQQNFSLESQNQSNFEFDYLYVLPESLFAGKYKIDVYAENTAGEAISKVFEIDFAKIPTFIDVKTKYAAEKGQTVQLEGTLNDEQGLVEYRLVSLDLALFLYYPIPNEPQSYAMNGEFIMPDWVIAGEYTAIMFAYNTRGLVNTINDVTIEVRDPD